MPGCGPSSSTPGPTRQRCCAASPRTRRRHPLAPQGRVADGIAAEEQLTAPLRQAADLVLDSSELNPAALRRAVEQRFGSEQGAVALALALVSFAFPAGLPREADMVFDARFLRNPHYDDALRPHTGRHPAVGSYIEADPDFAAFYCQLAALVGLVLPRVRAGGQEIRDRRHRMYRWTPPLGSHSGEAGSRSQGCRMARHRHPSGACAHPVRRG